MMTVATLILKLEQYPPDMPIAYYLYSEQCLMEETDIEIKVCGMPREDGWIHNERPDKPSQKYLMFPGN